MTTTPKLSYRPDIDGLRAIAVLSVLVYHARLSLFDGQAALPGGYLGVDVFFVISGYLISKIVFSEIQAGRFSLRAFYERRARRILPALTAVLVVVMITGFFVQLPQAYVDTGWTALTALLSSSNVFLWLTQGYEADSTLVNPLVHTWSLGVEEQYYFLFPVLAILFFLRVSRRAFAIGVLVIAALSLGFAQFASPRLPEFSFYMLPTRAWELAAGVLISLYQHRPRQSGAQSSDTAGPRWLIEALCFGAIATLCVCFVLFDHGTTHPGVVTVIPILASVILIALAPGAPLFSSVLGCRPLVFVGLISYSLYLWHQPVLAFSRLYFGENLGLWPTLGAFVASFVAAYASYLFVERPFRNRQLFTGRAIWWMSAAAAVVVSAMASAIVLAGGFANRLSQIETAIADSGVNYENLLALDGERCARRLQDMSDDLCRFSLVAPSPPEATQAAQLEQVGAVDIATFGDSIIRSLGPAIIDVWREVDANYVMLDRVGCPWVGALDRVSRDGNRLCTDATRLYRAGTLEQLSEQPILILGGRYAMLLSRERFDNGEGGAEAGDDHSGLVAPGAPWSQQASLDQVKSAMQLAVNDLLGQGARVVILYPVPEVGWHVPREMNALVQRGNQDPSQALRFDDATLSTSHERYMERNAQAFELLDSLDDHPNLIRVYPDRVLCDVDAKGRCQVIKDQSLLYRDSAHLSLAGSKLMAEHILARVQQVGWL